MTRALAWIALLVALVPAHAAAPAVEVQALLPEMAVLTIDGRRHTLKVGESVGEVELLEASSRQARVRIGEEVRTLGLSNRAGGGYKASPRQQVQVTRDASGHYRVSGAINGTPTMMMVDTGATILAMSSRHAEALGIDYRAEGKAGRVSTAGGMAPSYAVALDSVSVGGITVRGVQAAVVAGGYPEEILLGMSFLRHVGFSEDDGVLTIRAKY